MYNYLITVFSIGFFVVLTLSPKVGNTQPAYSEFRSSYIPTNKKNDPDNKAVCLVSCMSENAAASLMEEYIKNNDSKMFTLIITSLDRKKAGAIIDEMDRSFAVKGLKMLNAEWVYEIVYFVSERTFKYLDDKLEALENYSVR